MGIFIKNNDQVEKMRAASRIVAQAHEELEKYIKPGVTTGELNKIAEEFIRGKGGIPSFLGYRGYPAATNMSVNDAVIHGIPGLRRLKNGDIISIDIGVILNKFHGDAARTHPVGEVKPQYVKLIEVTRQSFFEAIRYAKHGGHLNEVCSAIEDYVTSYGYTVVREWCGHGVGRQLHEDPQIPNHRMKGRGAKIERNMTFAIEPMVNEGKADVRILDDEWTVVTKDGKFSAHYENTIVVTDGEPEILTL
ncbi:MAG: type I methionyl aminopeptidase [Clostridiales bacterium]|jgi:methionyl aminopeptidase|nr:type I methionyl aminopeptidase [Clostridiales bacterium]